MEFDEEEKRYMRILVERRLNDKNFPSESTKEAKIVFRRILEKLNKKDEESKE